MRKPVLSATLLLLLLAMSLVPTALAADDDEQQTVAMVSGNGSPPGRDPLNEFSTDGGVTWDHAYTVSKYSVYADPIPGSEWISIDANLGFPVGDNQEIRYRRFFDLPKDCQAKRLSVILHVDNDAGVFLNGVPFGSTPLGQILSNFQGAPEGPFTTTGPFQKRGNLLEFRGDGSRVVAGLDYEATLTCADDDDDDDDHEKDDHDHGHDHGDHDHGHDHGDHDHGHDDGDHDHGHDDGDHDHGDD
jgi:hypothetical protein